MGCFYERYNLTDFSYESTIEIKLIDEKSFTQKPKVSSSNSTTDTKQLEINSYIEKKNPGKEKEIRHIKKILTRISLEKFNSLFDDNLDDYNHSSFNSTIKMIKSKNYDLPKMLNVHNLTKGLNTTNDYTFETL